MFPHDPDDEDLFMTSPRSRTSSATFLSKLSSKVRHTTRTDITALQQVSIVVIGGQCRALGAGDVRYSSSQGIYNSNWCTLHAAFTNLSF